MRGNQEIGVRTWEIQRQLRRFGAASLDLAAVRRVWALTDPEAHRILTRLVQAGYLTRDPARPQEGRWVRTPAGAELAEAPLPRPLTRARSERLLGQVLRRVAQINRKPYYLCRVTAVGVFGDYLTEAPIIDTLDLVVQLVPKESIPGESHEVRKTHRRLPYWWLQRLLPPSEWPRWRERHVERALVTGLGRVVLHRVGDPILRGQRVRLVFLENPVGAGTGR